MNAVLLALALAAASHPHKTKIAILDVQDVSGDQAAHARALTQIITGEVGRDGTIDVISSNQIRDMLGFEKQKQLLGCSEGSCLAEIGGALGVDYLLTSQLAKLGSRYRLDLSLVDQAKAHTEAQVGEFLPAEEDALADTAVRMVNELLQKAQLRKVDSPVLDAAITRAAPETPRGAKVAFYVSGGLAIAAGAMTVLTYATFQKAKTSPDGDAAYDRLRWMGPLTDGLWGGAIIAAGTGTILKLSARPTGSGGEVSVGGSF